ncbi:uncharacterized protein [Solanum tuberosum]|uniref:VQ domain-containing protein n=1 Tax=Solanum tuberosum TaxID=4113 RepID=M0ZNY7_SOLTU|nr:PREDICTED: uncharacterized protein LOC107062088 [Solanum tuberosum]KAH0679615.1 hypothetical protein KY284_020700 [Solanum tuberosum]KAH0683095.1 hypothetical protein KY289_020847 [Solanum tuberosum]KAH0747180.1 hypothetical protein KY285_008837 [Solanum tuberosum]
MDSGNNSASLQSSSTGGVGGGVSVGGDEEYDSRAASQSFSTAFHTQNSSMFDPFINFFDPISRPEPPPLPPPSQNHATTQNSIYDLEFHWNSKRIRTDQTNNPLMLLPSSDFNNSLSFDTTTGNISFPSRSEEHHAVGGNVSVTTFTEQPAGAGAADQPIAQQARNTKKRSRASRKAPTTVLTTDTTNFRAMVQEFTGIPGPPFTAPSYFPIRNRFGLFTSAPNSAVRSVAPPNNNPNFFISQPSSNYLPRPFPQNIQPPPPYLSPSSSSSPLVLNRLPINIASASSTTTSATNYQLPTGVANSVAQGSNNFNSIQQNSIFTSLLQCSQKYPFGLKQQQQFQMPSNNISQFQMPSNNISQFQMPSSMNSSVQHGHLLTELPNLISEEQAATASSINDNTIFHGNKVQETVNATSDNLQETVVATNFHGGKVQETVAATKGVEGMVESWLLSTD